MTSFDRVEAAQRVRDAIARQASRIVEQKAPKGIVGRVVTLDPRTLRGLVWFPGDDQPIEVNFFASNLPASWQDKDGTWTGADQTSTQGHGSMVVVERFNGKLWVTNVLSGGQFGYLAKNLGMELVDRYPNVGVDLNVADNNSGIVGVDHTDAWHSVLVGYSQSIGELSAIEFGPFSFWGGGYWEVRIGGFYGDEGTRVYKFNLAGWQEFLNAGDEYSGWMRVLPDRESSNSGDTSFTQDWDFDIGFRKSEYTVDPESGETTGYDLWMRITQVVGSSSIVYQVSMKTRSVVHPGGNNSGQDFVQRQVVNPEPPVGYLGFHNAQNAFEARGNYAIADTFSRPATGNWDTTPTSMDTASGLKWTINGGAAADYGIVRAWFDDPDDTFGETYAFHHIGVVGAQTRRSMLEGTYTDVDLTATVSFEDLPVGGNLQFFWAIRWKNSGNDLILARLDFNPAGDATLVLSKAVAGVFTTVGSNVPVGTGFVPGDRLSFRVKVRGTTIRMKAWYAFDDAQPEQWMKTDTIADASLITAGQVAACMASTNTVTGPVPLRGRWHSVDMELRRPDGGKYNGDVGWSSGAWRGGLVRLANDLQRTWICEGLFTWNGTHLKWDSPIWMLGVGANRNGLHQGLAGLECPPSGAEVPAMPNNTGGGEFRLVTSNGVNLLPGDALYVGIEPGAKRSVDSLNDFLFVVRGDWHYTDYVLPEWAVLIASVGPSGGVVRLGNGKEVFTGSNPIKRIQSGKATVVISGANNGSVVVPLTGFTSVPAITTTVQSAAGTTIGSTVLITAISSSSVTFRLGLTASATVSPQIHWIAVEQ